MPMQDWIHKYPGAQALLQQGASPGSFTMTFERLCQVDIPGSMHQLGTAALHVEVVDVLGRPDVLHVAHGQVHADTKDVTLTFITPASGTVILSPQVPTRAGRTAEPHSDTSP